jgi:hypothetical protein
MRGWTYNMLDFSQTVNTSSQYASILGLLLTFWTWRRVQNVRRLVGRQSIHRGVFALFDEILLFPDDKRALTKSNTETVSQLVLYLEQFYVSRAFWRHRDAKVLLKKIKIELGGTRLTSTLNRDLQFLRDQLFSVENT